MQKQSHKNNHNKYKDIIIERLTQNAKKEEKKSDSKIYSLKTQCTPNDKSQDVYEKMFENFQNNFKLRYKPIILKQKPKPIGRCLYPELIQLSRKNSLSASGSIEKFRKTRANTQMTTYQQSDNKKLITQVAVKKQNKVSKFQKVEKLKKKILQTDIGLNQPNNMKRNRSQVSLKTQNPIVHLQRAQSKKQLKQTKQKKGENNKGFTNFNQIYSMKTFKSVSKKSMSKNV